MQRSPAAYSTAAGKAPSSPGNPVSFSIQLSVTSSPADLNQPLWKDIGYKVEEVREDGKYKYQVRNIATYTQAQEIKDRAQASGFPGAFVVAYRDGRRISMEEALRSAN